MCCASQDTIFIPNLNDENKKETLEVIEENQNAIKDKLIQEIKAKNNRDEMDNKKKNPCCSFRNFLSSQSSHNSKKTEGVKID